MVFVRVHQVFTMPINFEIMFLEILRGMRDTADHEEEWGDINSKELDMAMMTTGLLHDVLEPCSGVSRRRPEA